MVEVEQRVIPDNSKGGLNVIKPDPTKNVCAQVVIGNDGTMAPFNESGNDYGKKIYGVIMHRYKNPQFALPNGIPSLERVARNVLKEQVMKWIESEEMEDRPPVERQLTVLYKALTGFNDSTQPCNRILQGIAYSYAQKRLGDVPIDKNELGAMQECITEFMHSSVKDSTQEASSCWRVPMMLLMSDHLKATGITPFVFHFNTAMNFNLASIRKKNLCTVQKKGVTCKIQNPPEGHRGIGSPQDPVRGFPQRRPNQEAYRQRSNQPCHEEAAIAHGRRRLGDYQG